MCLACAACQLACCACRICTCCAGKTCTICGKAFKASASRIAYAVTFVVFCFCAWLLGYFIPENRLRVFPPIDECSDGDRTCIYNVFVSRILFGLTLYHGALSVLLICTSSGRDFRVHIHEGFLPIRLLLLGGITFGCLYIPNDFFKGYNYVSMVGGFIFLILQVILLIEFAYSAQYNLVSKMEDEQNEDGCHKWFASLLALVIFMFAGAITICVLLYVYFTDDSGGECAKAKLNIFFITFNIVIAFILSIISILPGIREKRPDSGLVQSGMIALYCSYLVFSSITSEPVSWIKGCNSFVRSETDGSGVYASSPKRWTDILSMIIGGILTILAVVWSTVQSSKVTLCSDDESGSGNNETDGDADQDNPDAPVPYSFSYFHLIYALGAMYVSQLLTNWQVINTHDADTYGRTGITVDGGIASVWIKIVASWIVFAFYLWSLVAPFLCPNREWN